MKLRGYINLLEEVAKTNGDELPVVMFNQESMVFENIYALPDVEELIFSPYDNAWVRPTEKQKPKAALVVHL